MANFTFTTTANYVLVDIDGKQNSFKSGDLYPYIPDRAGSQVFIIDTTGVLKNPDPSKNRIELNIGVDTINVNGSTVWLNSGALFDALSGIFFLASSSISIGELNNVVEVATPIVQNVWTDLSGVWVALQEIGFDSPNNGELRYLGTSLSGFFIAGQIILSGGAFNEVEIRFAISRDDGLSFIEFSRVFQRQMNFQFLGQNRLALTVIEPVVLGPNDRVKIQVRNTSSGANLTAVTDSYFLIYDVL